MTWRDAKSLTCRNSKQSAAFCRAKLPHRQSPVDGKMPLALGAGHYLQTRALQSSNRLPALALMLEQRHEGAHSPGLRPCLAASLSESRDSPLILLDLPRRSARDHI